MVGDDVDLTLPEAVANSGDGPPYAYNLWKSGTALKLNEAPVNGLFFDAATRRLTGTPETPETLNLDYVLDDGDAVTGDADNTVLSFSITVNPGLVTGRRLRRAWGAWR